ncbi:Leo1-like protein-domain-containing protein [Dipodascopsis uninucleata]
MSDSGSDQEATIIRRTGERKPKGLNELFDEDEGDDFYSDNNNENGDHYGNNGERKLGEVDHGDHEDNDDDDGDLFGDEDNDEEMTDDAVAAQIIPAMDAVIAGDEEEEEEDDMFGGSIDDDDNKYGEYGSPNDMMQDEEPEYEEVEMQEMEITMPRYLTSHTAPSKLSITRIPNFLNIEYSAFDPGSYLEIAENIQGEDADDLRKRLRAEVQNTIRWRYVQGENSQMKIQSNVRVIKWSDGSMSLKLGKEIFDITEKPVDDTYLAVSHDEQEIVQFQARVDSSMTIVPTSTSSITHMRLSKAISRGNVKVRNVHDIATVEDPEKMIREAEKAEESKLRARKKLDSKRRQRENRYNYDRDHLGGGTGAGTESQYDDGMGYGGKDSYEKDDFVVSDEEEEEEEEERAARLRKLKKVGAEKYKGRNRSEEDEDEEDEEEEEDEDKENEEDDDDDEDEDELTVPKRSGQKRRRDNV